MMAALQNIQESFQMRQAGIHRFHPQFPFQLEFGPYRLKTAQTRGELVESFKLRNQVFNLEFRGLKGRGLDFDQFDSRFDHLLIFHQDSHEVIGTYRVRVSDQPSNSYTALEFSLDGIKSFEGPFLELGRACIAQQHRRGAVISLLWRGIAEYMKASGAQTLFGCSSVKINNSRQAALVYKSLQLKGLVLNQGCYPTKNYRFDHFQQEISKLQQPLTETQLGEVESLIPPLLKSYLKLGSRILAEPAFDKDFDCLDFLTVLKRSDLSKSIDRKFNVSASQSANSEA